MARKRATNTLPLSTQKLVKDARKQANTLSLKPEPTPTPSQTPEEILRLLPTDELERLLQTVTQELESRKPAEPPKPDLRATLEAWKARNNL